MRKPSRVSSSRAGSRGSPDDPLHLRLQRGVEGRLDPPRQRPRQRGPDPLDEVRGGEGDGVADEPQALRPGAGQLITREVALLGHPGQDPPLPAPCGFEVAVGSSTDGRCGRPARNAVWAAVRLSAGPPKYARLAASAPTRWLP